MWNAEEFRLSPLDLMISSQWRLRIVTLFSKMPISVIFGANMTKEYQESPKFPSRSLRSSFLKRSDFTRFYDISIYIYIFKTVGLHLWISYFYDRNANYNLKKYWYVNQIIIHRKRWYFLVGEKQIYSFCIWIN